MVEYWSAASLDTIQHCGNPSVNWHGFTEIHHSWIMSYWNVFSVCSISTWNFTSGNNSLVRKWAQNPLLHHHVLQIAMILGLFFPCWKCLARPRPQGCRSGPANSPLWLGRSSANLAECCQGWGGSARWKMGSLRKALPVKAVKAGRAELPFTWWKEASCKWVATGGKARILHKLQSFTNPKSLAWIEPLLTSSFIHTYHLIPLRFNIGSSYYYIYTTPGSNWVITQWTPSINIHYYNL